MELTLVKNWQRISVLGSGSFGEVSLWKSTDTDEYIAVKKCKWHSISMLDKKQIERWHNEVTIMNKLRNNNIVSCKELPQILEEALQIENPTKLPLLPMEYCRKGNLRHTLTQPQNLCGLKEPEIKLILKDMLSAISYLHSLKIIHRDIKPDNIVLQDCKSRASGTVYKLIDLGFAKALADSNVSFVGTMQYLAPEILVGQNYDLSVDYWSFGVLCFEICCGLLPFPSFLSNPERYKYIKEKGSENICLVQTLNGNLQYSPCLLRQNHLSSCFKENLESWLGHVLEYEPKKRYNNFANSKTVFEYLADIVERKVVKVFNVLKYEFYYYEIDECTRLTTLQQWIARDTKIQESEQILLSTIYFNGAPKKCDLVQDCLSKDDLNIYIFKKDNTIKKNHPTLPPVYKFIFENIQKSFKWKEIKPIYAQCIFYIWQDKKHLFHFLNALRLFVKYTKILSFTFTQNGKLVRGNVIKLLTKLECFNKTKKNNLDKKSKNVLQLKECLEKYQSTVTTVQDFINSELFINIKTKEMAKKVEFLETSLPKIYEAINVEELEKISKYALDLLVKENAAFDSEKIYNCKEICQIISIAIKHKDQFLRNVDLLNFISVLGNIFKNIISFQERSKTLLNDIEVLSKKLNSVEREFLEAMKTQKVPLEIEAKNLIQENMKLRANYQNLLNRSILFHYNFTKESKNYNGDVF